MEKKETKKVTKESEKDSFYKLTANRAKVFGESKNSVLFINYYKKDDKSSLKTYYAWLPKKIVFKNEYALILNISIPKSWEEFEFNNGDGETYTTTDITEFCELLGFKLKK